jgi:hypothetical protein
MALKAEVEDINTVEEPFRSLYTEKDGKHILTGVEGMVPVKQVTDLRTETGAYRIKLKDAETKLATYTTNFGELDPVATRAILDRVPELEIAAAGKLDDAAINKLVEGRIVTKLAPLERERDTLKTQVGTLTGEVDGFKTKDKQRAISDAIRGAATTSKVRATAVEDAIILGERVFEVGEDGAVTAKVGVGCTPGIDPATWFVEMQPKRVHWWDATIGGGAIGNGGSGDIGGVNPFSAETWNMTQQGALVRTNPAKADMLAKQAGTTVGGMKPQPRK